MTRDRAASAANRFGLGARPGDLQAIGGDPRGWLLAQLQGDGGMDAFASLPSSRHYLHQEAQARRLRKAAPRATAGEAAQATFRRMRQDQQQELDLRLHHALDTADGFSERLVRFWSNHFAVSADKRTAAPYAAPMEREAVRPHLYASFAELLLAVETHPAMLRYLDNVDSIGDDSRLAQRVRRRAKGAEAPRRVGLNENLAREILELHTLGVAAGYRQEDVTALAQSITGWGVPLPREMGEAVPASSFVFRDSAHAAGPRQLLGRHYADDGFLQGRRMLADLAVHPATARHVCTRLAGHFVADSPPVALVEAMVRAWLRHDGALLPVYRTLVEAGEAWDEAARKFRTPDDYLLAVARAGDRQPQPRRYQQLLSRMGQPAFLPRSPAGWPDATADWSGGDALWKRLQAAVALADVVTGASPQDLARQALGTGVGGELMAALRGAGSPREGYVLLLASPDFQWRI